MEERPCAVCGKPVTLRPGITWSGPLTDSARLPIHDPPPAAYGDGQKADRLWSESCLGRFMESQREAGNACLGWIQTGKAGDVRPRRNHEV